MALSSPSNTPPSPRTGGVDAGDFTTEPFGARLPVRTAMPPLGVDGIGEGTHDVTVGVGGSRNLQVLGHGVARHRQAVAVTRPASSSSRMTTPRSADMNPTAGFTCRLDRSRLGVVMRELLEAGLVHGDCLTVSGHTVAENLEILEPPDPDGDVVRPSPIPSTPVAASPSSPAASPRTVRW